uniref:Ubiquitin carboxyl-terminal hydrolase MINDY n=1 Tax=Saimiri boliviensis boliviensis TaxID=39432 RepID=A0A2K6UYQ8_SAIBB
MSELTKELMELVWGTKSSPGLSDTIFCRWTQGFVFSESEGSALEQFEGGPCAVIAPVQAFLLKKLLFSSEKSAWRDCSEEEQKELLCHTFCDILESACCDHSGPYCLVSWLRGKTTEETASISGSPAESSCQVEHSSMFFFLCFIFFHHPCLLSFLFCLPLFSKLLSLCLLLKYTQ